MRPEPVFPVWNTATPPDNKKWLAASALIVLVTGGGSALLRGMQQNASALLAIMLLTLVVLGSVWLCRLIYYRTSVHHATQWHQAVEREHQQWWADHQRPLALSDVFLIGPCGSDLADWVRVLKREQRVPEARQESSGKALRIARTFSTEIIEREQQLARSLVLLWHKERQDVVCAFAGCYWQSSDAAWRAFSSQMNLTLPEVLLPETPEAWNGEATLSHLAAQLQADSSQRFLVAGCQSTPVASGSPLPAGEAAVLWLVAADGPVQLTRGEVFDAASDGDLVPVTARALKQSELADVPDACIAFSHPELASCSWNVAQYLQDNYWGATGTMAPLVVISLAAILAHHQQQPCGWLASDPQHTLALGIVKPYGNG